jgi:hypothetical protein
MKINCTNTCRLFPTFCILCWLAEAIANYATELFTEEADRGGDQE